MTGPEGFRSLSAQYDLLPAGERVLCALSGGADSMCLLHLLLQAAPEEGFQVAAAHFNHGLRGDEAQRDEDFVRKTCARWGVPLTVGRGDVRAFARQEGQTIEEAARTMRYAFLEECAQASGCTRIATAHNADDNLETLLLHLVRGAGLHGLAGIPPRRGRLIRPLLAVSRAEIEAYLERHGVPHVEDSSNADAAFARNRLRHQVIPVLRSLNPRLSKHSAQTMGYLRLDNDYLNTQALKACEQARRTQEGLTIPAQAVACLPEALAPRAARRLLELTARGNTDCSAAHLRALVALARSGDPSGELSLPGGRLARRVYGDLVLTVQAPPPEPFSPTPLVREGETSLTGTPWRCRCRGVICPQWEARRSGAFYLAKSALEEGALLRPRQSGDVLALPGRGTKSIKKLFIDARIPRRERGQVPILADSRGVAAAAGFGPDRSRAARPGEDAWELVFWKKEV